MSAGRNTNHCSDQEVQCACLLKREIGSGENRRFLDVKEQIEYFSKKVGWMRCSLISSLIDMNAFVFEKVRMSV